RSSASRSTSAARSRSDSVGPAKGSAPGTCPGGRSLVARSRRGYFLPTSHVAEVGAPRVPPTGAEIVRLTSPCLCLLCLTLIETDCEVWLAKVAVPLGGAGVFLPDTVAAAKATLPVAAE